MQQESPYSPVLWSAICIPVISGLEIFIDPVTRSSYGLFVLGFFYLVSIRYTLAVGLGVYAYEIALKKLKLTRAGAILWICYFMILLLCSLLVPGAAIFGLLLTTLLTLFILIFSIAQGVISRKSFADRQRSDITWRIFIDILLLVLLIYECFLSSEKSFQSTFFTIIIILLTDFTISDFARATLGKMFASLKDYLTSSWSKTGDNTT